MKKAFIIGSAAMALASGVSFLILSCKNEIGKGSYKCHYCNTLFRPNMIDYALSFHTPTRRKLPCPVCGNIGLFRHVDEEPTINNEHDTGVITDDDSKIFREFLDHI